MERARTECQAWLKRLDAADFPRGCGYAQSVPDEGCQNGRKVLSERRSGVASWHSWRGSGGGPCVVVEAGKLHRGGRGLAERE